MNKESWSCSFSSVYSAKPSRCCWSSRWHWRCCSCRRQGHTAGQGVAPHTVKKDTVASNVHLLVTSCRNCILQQCHFWALAMMAGRIVQSWRVGTTASCAVITLTQDKSWKKKIVFITCDLHFLWKFFARRRRGLPSEPTRCSRSRRRRPQWSCRRRRRQGPQNTLLLDP